MEASRMEDSQIPKLYDHSGAKISAVWKQFGFIEIQIIDRFSIIIDDRNTTTGKHVNAIYYGDLQLPMKSVSITTNVVSLNPVQVRYSIQRVGSKNLICCWMK
jgi:hypothetical protein